MSVALPPRGPAAVALLDAVDAHRAADRLPPRTAVEAALTAFQEEALQAGAEEDLAAVEEAVGQLLLQYEGHCARHGIDMARGLTNGAAFGLPGLIDRAMVPFVRRDELAEATAVLQEVQAEQQRQLDALERAVGAADLPEVLRLRQEVEVALPVKLGKARVRVAELALDRSRVQVEAMTARADSDYREARRVEQLSAAAYRKYEELIAQLESCNMLATSAKDRARESELAFFEEEAEVEKMKQALVGEEQARFRKLAGLDPLPPVIEAEEELDPLIYDTRASIRQTGNSPTTPGRGLYRGIDLGRGPRYRDGSVPEGESRLRGTR